MSSRRSNPGDATEKPVIERTVEPLANGLGEGIGWLADRGVLFAVFLLVWLALGAMLILSPETARDIWASLGGQPLVLQIGIWVLFLPVMAAWWIWQTGWPDVVRFLVVLGLAVWTLRIFKPKWLVLPGR